MLENSTMQVAVIAVWGMTCQHCAQTLQKALAGVEGITRAQVDLSRNEAHVTYDGDAVSISRLFQAVTTAGFSPEGFTRGPAGEND